MFGAPEGLTIHLAIEDGSGVCRLHRLASIEVAIPGRCAFSVVMLRMAYSARSGSVMWRSMVPPQKTTSKVP